MKAKATQIKVKTPEKKSGRSVPELAALVLFLFALIIYFLLPLNTLWALKTG